VKQSRKGRILELHVVRLKERSPCVGCGSGRVRSKGRYERRVRHLESFGRDTRLRIECRRFHCLECNLCFVEPLPGIEPGRHSSEPFRKKIYDLHHEGIPSSNLGRRERIGAATVSRIYSQFTQRKAKERIRQVCPRVLGIDEHTLHKKKRFATTFCDLENHRVFDVTPGKSAQDLAGFLGRLRGKNRVQVVCIDLSSSYRSLVRQYFPNALIVADRFHVVRVMMYHFSQLARLLVPSLALYKGQLGLLRKAPKKLNESEKVRLNALLEEHSVLKPIRHQMHYWRALLNKKHQSEASCGKLAARFLKGIQSLRESGFAPMQTLSNTLSSWSEEIGRMWRFAKNNGITEGFHRKMKLIQRRAYGFRNFENYRLRVIAACG
jgi:transposase